MLHRQSGPVSRSSGGTQEEESKTSITSKILSKITMGARKDRWLVASAVVDPTKKKDNEDNTSSFASDNKWDETRMSVMSKYLVELRVDNLQITPLAKSSPTSFLNGKEDEVLRTCEYEAAPFQMEIPSCKDLTVTALLNEFVENYRHFDQNLDLHDWVDLTRWDLKQVKVKEHIPIAQLLLECGEDVVIRGFVSAGTDCDNRVEAVVIEGQRNFTVVMRGPTEQQARPTRRNSLVICADHANTKIYRIFLDEYHRIATKCFDLLDKLTEECPFCDVVFTGHSFGGALSTLAAARYANARPMMRVTCYPMASPKVGLTEFRQMVNSSPNLRVMRLEYGQDGKCQFPSHQAGSHVGHTIVLSPSLGNNAHKVKDPVLAYKFDVPKLKNFKTINPDLRSYVAALEEISRLDLPWAKEFVGTTGSGVVVGLETRQMV
jgi:hypothetical protein